MKVKYVKYNSFLFNSVVFLVFLGFYAIILLLFNAGMGDKTRLVTIPVRLLIGVLCGFILFRSIKKKNKQIKWFFLFVLAYFARISIDYSMAEYFYISYSNLVFYFISFVIIPFIAISKMDFSKICVKSLFNTFLASAFIFSVLSVLLYSRFIGTVGRLSTSVAGEDVVNPLLLSYCATLIIGVLVFYIMYNKTSKIQKLVIYITISLSIVPFFLGSSRGSLFALFFPFIVLMFSSVSPKNIYKIASISIASILTLIFLDNYMGSGLLDRFISTQDAISSGSESAVRLQIWKQSLEQFLSNVILGDSLNTKQVNHYPHNIYIESLQQTGLLGFIPFAILIITAIKYVMYIFKRYPKYGWLTIFFLQAMMQNMFSGALYTAAWFWAGMAIVFSLRSSLKPKYNMKI